MKNIFLDFYGIRVACKTNSSELHEKLCKDFDFFLKEESSLETDFFFTFLLDEIPWHVLDGQVATKLSANAMSVDCKHIRCNNYYGRALSVYDFKNNKCTIYSKDLNKLHELSYLLILSRTGKKLDLKGLHKIHAFGIAYRDCAMIGMMPMKGGKTSLFLDLLAFPDVQIISDDTPFISTRGEILPCPLRVGLQEGESYPDGPKDLVYTLEREHYGPKVLLPMKYFSNKISIEKKKKVLVFEGKRKFNKECLIVSTGLFSMLVPTIKHMLVGVGLPLILEYFLESGKKDWIIRFIILVRRFFAMMCLLLRAQRCIVYLGTDREKNAKTLYQFLQMANEH